MITHKEPLLLPSDTDVQFYREHGWYRSPRVLSEDVLDAAFIGISRHFDGERDWLFPPEQVFRLESIGRQLRGLGCAPTSRRCIFSPSAHWSRRIRSHKTSRPPCGRTRACI